MLEADGNRKTIDQVLRIINICLNDSKHRTNRPKQYELDGDAQLFFKGISAGRPTWPAFILGSTLSGTRT
jgi:hypothetical protein